jgi:hypothetical protein
MKALIDWSDFIKIALLVLVLYYAIIGVRFYKYEILRLFGIKRVSNESGSKKGDSEEAVEG